MTPLTFSLIIVLSTGDVRYTPGFTDLHTCLEARSLATTGTTLEAVEQKAADDMARETDLRIKRMAADEHPHDQWLVFSNGTSGSNYYPLSQMRTLADGSVALPPLPGGSNGEAFPYSNNVSPPIKAAECFVTGP